MSEKTKYMNVAFAINRAIEEAEKIQCDCNKYLESKCDRCCLIETLNKQMEDIICIANRKESES